MTAPRDRSAYLRDADYFATQLVRCLEHLAKIESDGETRAFTRAQSRTRTGPKIAA